MSTHDANVKSGVADSRSPVISEALLAHYLDRGRALQAQALRRGLVAVGRWCFLGLKRQGRIKGLGHPNNPGNPRSPQPRGA
ncbi:MAG: hypothetical protein ACFCBW_07200 [Candidatus Competibacterales bacterium]